MLLFLMGVDLPTIGLIVLLLLIFGRLIFWLTKKLLRKTMKDSSEEKIKTLSRVSAFILSPTIVIGALALLIYISSIQATPRESDEEMERNHYEMMEEDLREDLKIGMSKTDVVGLFGEADTTQSVLIYDLSLPDGKEKYILEITFDSKGLTDFKRRR